MELQTMICPKCNGQLYFESGQDTCFCSHCGTQVFRNDSGKRTFTYRTIDEAKIKEHEIVHDIAIKQIEYKERKEKKSFKQALIVLGIILGLNVVLWTFIISVSSSGEKEYQKIAAEMTTLGKISAGSEYDYKDKNYKSAIAMLETAGFTNIETVELNDASSKDGIIDTIAIGGKSDFKREDFWDPDVKIIITYH